MPSLSGLLDRLATYTSPRAFAADARNVLVTNWARVREACGSRAVRCQLCGWEGHRFRPRSFGGWYAAEQLCPRCHSYPRHRILAHYVTSTGLDGTCRDILDIGAGASLASLFRRPGQTYLKGDIVKARDVDVQVDVQAMPFAEATQDLVICLHVLDHVRDDRLGVRELARVLRPGGTCILQGRLNPNLAETIDYYPRFSPSHRLQHRDYGRDYADRFADAGLHFERVVVGPSGDARRPEQFHTGDDVFYVGRKR